MSRSVPVPKDRAQEGTAEAAVAAAAAVRTLHQRWSRHAQQLQEEGAQWQHAVQQADALIDFMRRFVTDDEGDWGKFGRVDLALFEARDVSRQLGTLLHQHSHHAAEALRLAQAAGSLGGGAAAAGPAAALEEQHAVHAQAAAAVQAAVRQQLDALASLNLPVLHRAAQERQAVFQRQQQQQRRREREQERARQAVAPAGDQEQQQQPRGDSAHPAALPNGMRQQLMTSLRVALLPAYNTPFRDTDDAQRQLRRYTSLRLLPTESLQSAQPDAVRKEVLLQRARAVAAHAEAMQAAAAELLAHEAASDIALAAEQSLVCAAERATKALSDLSSQAGGKRSAAAPHAAAPTEKRSCAAR